MYQDVEGNLVEDNLISFEGNTNDLKWHRIGISIKGDSITLILDCTKQITKKLLRTPNPRIAIDGLIFMGVQLDEEEDYFMVKILAISQKAFYNDFLQGDVQTLMIADRPDSAYEVCTKFAPNCSGSQTFSVIDESDNGSSRSISSSQRGENSVSRSNLEQNSSANGNINGRGLDTAASSSTVNERNRPLELNSVRNFGITASKSAVSGNLNMNGDASLMSRDNSAESDGLGLGFNGEDEYYDSLNSGDENEISSSQFNRTRISTPDVPVVPIYNPEPGLNINDYDDDFDGRNTENENTSKTFNTSTFSTVVNGVKIKSLPGPRGSLSFT